ncbi:MULTISPECIES: cytochrome o ubiquinol oxidase subunit IV [unclassified Janthinobacterium]|uniref:Cytochrome bo(3) ubiquinol oxidase subunit 4 n=1 Tax=Janthinobacterium lividum TaxID=29581 RepID=A0A1E8PJF2_9BURK|nr:cytochrome o ubiquinol oxidase subunit IV [Janthinobacterium sp. CG_23.4]MCL6483116.1 cytochrome o ubiquinol oxidase subunit IV [Janthinobacterium lividum]MDH6158154.1 cytochrome o ubiquinol oxidase operon protein cyoD [Janthinobacterium sp. CG_23.4]OFJ46325.1 cytochrome o ubiquinol oxidase subunit IV [Janthinobacterium lividum]
MSDHHTHGDSQHHDQHDHGSLKSYTIGFILSVILTAIPFWLVMTKVITDSSTMGLVLLAFAAVQVVVHMVYFLHMNTKSEGGWNMMALIFTIMMVVIAMAGSVWVMYHMNHNMMPDLMPEYMHTKTAP